MKSATEMLLNKTFEEIWHRGEKYTDGGKINILNSTDKEVEAEAIGTKRYTVNLKFSGNGISRKCTCPYTDRSSSYRPICKHMVGVAILWDEMRGIPRPMIEEIESYTIPPPLVTRSQIDAIWRDPLNADLEILRIAAEERGTWSRPHSRLPNMPNFDTNENKPLTIKEVKKAFQEIKRWAGRRAFDPYFCAGEMTAAFCEVLRIVKKRVAVTSLIVSAQILREAQKFHYTLVMELIDDSSGHWQFNEAHLNDLYESLKKITVTDNERETFEQKLQEFDDHSDEY